MSKYWGSSSSLVIAVMARAAGFLGVLQQAAVVKDPGAVGSQLDAGADFAELGGLLQHAHA
jgi:hypothetical protein